MPSRPLLVNGVRWEVTPAGRITPLDGDEFALVFTRHAADTDEVRVTRYAPQGVMSRDASLAAMSDANLRDLFEMSQPSFTSPEVGYRR